MGDGAELSFVVRPAGAGVIMVNGTAAPATPTRYARGTVLRLQAVAAEGFVLDSWNDGEWFEEEWAFTALSDRTITAVMSEG